jgi:hypothetical protein
MDESKPSGEGGERKWRPVYTIIERPGDPSGRKVWLRIGTAFNNRDHSINVRLDAIPTNGQLQIRDYEPYPDGRGGAPARRDEFVYRNQEGGL